MNQSETENETTAVGENVAPASPPRRFEGPSTEGPRGAGPGRGPSDEERPRRRMGRRRRVGIMRADKIKVGDYKNVNFLRRFISDRDRPDSTAVQVDETKYTVRYYTERLRKFIQEIGGASKQIGQNPQLALGAVSDELIEEAIVLRFAEEKGQTATDDEVKAQIATLLSITPDAADFDK